MIESNKTVKHHVMVFENRINHQTPSTAAKYATSTAHIQMILTNRSIAEQIDANDPRDRTNTHHIDTPTGESPPVHVKSTH